jgi:glycolate oxidase FAD binding subunit
LTATAADATAPSSTVEVREQVRDAASRGCPLRIVGSGSWLDANRPVRACTTLVMRALAGIVEYEPGDLTLTARAGTTLEEIARATTAHGQWLALDPHGDPARATIGATIATASTGPLARAFGSPRDMTLGIEFVTGKGEIARGGGRVVKNVAGFDLTRLLTGSWGSLGVVTEVTLRLRALPAVQRTVAVDVGPTIRDIEAMRLALHKLPFSPLAATLLDAVVAHELAVGDSVALLVRLGGNEEAVRAQQEQLRSLGEPRDVDAVVWRQLRTAEAPRAAVLRLSRLPSRFAATWRDATQIVEKWPHGYCHGDPGRGVARAILPLPNQTAGVDLATLLGVPYDGTRIFERLPAELWPSLTTVAIRGRIETGIKAAFDPHNILNPGILGEMS